jgi:hypothetical protein
LAKGGRLSGATPVALAMRHGNIVETFKAPLVKRLASRHAALMMPPPSGSRAPPAPARRAPRRASAPPGLHGHQIAGGGDEGLLEPGSQNEHELNKCQQYTTIQEQENGNGPFRVR